MQEEVKIKTSWDNVTLGEYQQFCQISISDMEDDIDFRCTILSIFSDKDYSFWESVSIEDFMKAGDRLDFIATPPSPSAIKHKYTIEGRHYNIAESIPKLKDCPISELKAGHLIGLHKTKNSAANMTPAEQINNLHNMLSVMMIPKGMQYGVEGYSVSENAEHLQRHLGIRDALAVSAFFLILWKGLTDGINASLEREMKKMVKKGTLDRKMMDETMKMIRLTIPYSQDSPLLKNGAGKK